MSEKSCFLHFTVLIPLVLSCILFISILFFLNQKTPTSLAFIELSQNQIPLFISIRGFIAIVILVYIVFRIFGMTRILFTTNGQARVFVNKMNAVREIIEIIFTRKI